MRLVGYLKGNSGRLIRHILHFMQNSALPKNAKHNLNKIVICLCAITSTVEGGKALVNVPQMNGIYVAGKRKIKINDFNNGH